MNDERGALRPIGRQIVLSQGFFLGRRLIGEAVLAGELGIEVKHQLAGRSVIGLRVAIDFRLPIRKVVDHLVLPFPGHIVGHVGQIPVVEEFLVRPGQLLLDLVWPRNLSSLPV